MNESSETEAWRDGEKFCKMNFSISCVVQLKNQQTCLVLPSLNRRRRIGKKHKEWKLPRQNEGVKEHLSAARPLKSFTICICMVRPADEFNLLLYLTAKHIFLNFGWSNRPVPSGCRPGMLTSQLINECCVTVDSGDQSSIWKGGHKFFCRKFCKASCKFKRSTIKIKI